MSKGTTQSSSPRNPEKALHAAVSQLDDITKEVKHLKKGAEMFKAVQFITRRIAMKSIITDEDGRIVCNDEATARIMQHHFSHNSLRQVYANCPALLDIPSMLKH